MADRFHKLGHQRDQHGVEKSAGAGLHDVDLIGDVVGDGHRHVKLLLQDLVRGELKAASVGAGIDLYDAHGIAVGKHLRGFGAQRLPVRIHRV